MCEPFIGAFTIVYMTIFLTKYADSVGMQVSMTYALLASILYAKMFYMRDSVQKELASFTDPNREDVKLSELLSFYGFIFFFFIAIILYKVTGYIQSIVKREDKDKAKK